MSIARVWVGRVYDDTDCGRVTSAKRKLNVTAHDVYDNAQHRSLNCEAVDGLQAARFGKRNFQKRDFKANLTIGVYNRPMPKVGVWRLLVNLKFVRDRLAPKHLAGTQSGACAHSVRTRDVNQRRQRRWLISQCSNVWVHKNRWCRRSRLLAPAGSTRWRKVSRNG